MWITDRVPEDKAMPVLFCDERDRQTIVLGGALGVGNAWQPLPPGKKQERGFGASLRCNKKLKIALKEYVNRSYNPSTDIYELSLEEFNLARVYGIL